uniref:Ras-GAP domain-containing protein n=1 Tax=Eptatretus burgeri TaxID=7764 RepID=A0A8C4WU96_EPTBU
MRLIGDAYLREVLGDFVRVLYCTEEECEVEPAKCSVVELLAHRRNLRICCELVLGKILSSYSSFPVELRAVFASWRRLCVARGRADAGERLISAALFLRFLVPALATPSLAGLRQEGPEERPARTLALVARVLSNLATFTKFGSREDCLVFMNAFLEQQCGRLRQFLAEVSRSEVEDDASRTHSFGGHIDLGRELATLHALLADALLPEKGDSPLLVALGSQLDPLPRILAAVREAQRRPAPASAHARRVYWANGLQRSFDDKLHQPSSSDAIVRLPTPTPANEELYFVTKPATSSNQPAPGSFQATPAPQASRAERDDSPWSLLGAGSRSSLLDQAPDGPGQAWSRLPPCPGPLSFQNPAYQLEGPNVGPEMSQAPWLEHTDGSRGSVGSCTHGDASGADYATPRPGPDFPSMPAQRQPSVAFGADFVGLGGPARQVSVAYGPDYGLARQTSMAVPISTDYGLARQPSVGVPTDYSAATRQQSLGLASDYGPSRQASVAQFTAEYPGPTRQASVAYGPDYGPARQMSGPPPAAEFSASYGSDYAGRQGSLGLGPDMGLARQASVGIQDFPAAPRQPSLALGSEFGPGRQASVAQFAPDFSGPTRQASVAYGPDYGLARQPSIPAQPPESYPQPYPRQPSVGLDFGPGRQTSVSQFPSEYAGPTRQASVAYGPDFPGPPGRQTSLGLGSEFAAGRQASIAQFPAEFTGPTRQSSAPALQPVEYGRQGLDFGRPDFQGGRGATPVVPGQPGYPVLRQHSAGPDWLGPRQPPRQLSAGPVLIGRQESAWGEGPGTGGERDRVAAGYGHEAIGVSSSLSPEERTASWLVSMLNMADDGENASYRDAGDKEVNRLTERLAGAGRRLELYERRLQLQEEEMRRLQRDYQSRLSASEERLRRQQLEKDSQLRAVINRLLVVEDRLKRENVDGQTDSADSKHKQLEEESGRRLGAAQRFGRNGGEVTGEFKNSSC